MAKGSPLLAMEQALFTTHEVIPGALAFASTYTLKINPTRIRANRTSLKKKSPSNVAWHTGDYKQFTELTTTRGSFPILQICLGANYNYVHDVLLELLHIVWQSVGLL